MLANSSPLPRAPDLRLRPWRAEDAPALIAARAKTKDLQTQFSADAVATEDLAREFIAEALGFTERTKNWAVVVDCVPLGNLGLAHIERRHQTAWAYYWLAEPARGRGYAARGLRAVADWAFRDGLFRLELGHRVSNPASCRVATAAGFTAEGIERAKLRYGGERFDVETHARLATDPAPAAEESPAQLDECRGD